jgi:hypothetical protein
MQTDRLAGRIGDGANLPVHVECRSHRALAVVAVRYRSAEYGQRAVARMVDDLPSVAHHDAVSLVVEALHQRLHLLRIETRAQRRVP